MIEEQMFTTILSPQNCERITGMSLLLVLSPPSSFCYSSCTMTMENLQTIILCNTIQISLFHVRIDTNLQSASNKTIV